METRLIAIVLAALVPLGLLLLIQISMTDVEAAATWTVGVDPECSTIQECIDNASVPDGDIIFLPTGTYTEQISLNKVLTVRGAGLASTFVDAESMGRACMVTADKASFEDLTVRGGKASGAPSIGAGICSLGLGL